MIPKPESRRQVLICANLFLSIIWGSELRASGNENLRGEPAAVSYLPPKKLAELDNREIIESSGLAPSRRQADVFWTHNDSGDKPRLFALDIHGQHLGTLKVDVKKAHDWEDIASFEMKGTPYLLIADVGKSRKKDAALKLHLIVEPDPYDIPRRIHPVKTVSFRFDGGRPDCESMAFDTLQQKVLLATKSDGFVSRIFELDWPQDQSSKKLLARLVETIDVPMAVAMDISTESRYAIVLSYGGARLFPRNKSESWRETFSRSGIPVRMPTRRQGESICFGSHDLTLYLTSEKLPTPLFQVPVRESPAR